MKNQNTKLNIAQKYPILAFLLINFGWTWAFWLAAIPLGAQSQVLLTTLVIVGGFGPALAAVLTIGLSSSNKFDHSPKRLFALVVTAGILFALIATDLNFTPLAAGVAVLASLVGGWAFSSAVSSNKAVRERMSSIFPRRLSFGWLLFGFIFYPALILLAWGLGAILGMGVEYPVSWGQPVTEVFPTLLLTFGLTALAQGGNEEPGWRGFLQPELQKRFNPLSAALIVSFFWSLWHLPLYLNGFYPGDLVGGMVGGFIFRILLSIFLAWVYNRSGGSLLLMIVLHTSFNIMVNFLPTSDASLALLWLAIVIVIVIRDKMWQKRTNGQI